MANEQINEVPSEGNCYEASCTTAIDYQLAKEAVEHGTPSDAQKQAYEEVDLKNEIFVFHGYITSPSGPDAGKRVHHAWVEIGDVVLERQGGTARMWSRRNYYGTFSVYPNERYTPHEAHHHAYETPGYKENFCAWRGKGKDIC